jgi:alkaline phosphatase D
MMKKLTFSCLVLATVHLFSCATTTQGFLVQFDEQKAIDENSLERQCDMEDSGSCFLLRKHEAVAHGAIPMARGLAPGEKSILAALVDKNFQGNWFLFDRENKSLKKLAISKSVSRDHSNFRIDHIFIPSIPVGKTWEVFVTDSLGHLLDHREIHSLAPKISPAKFAVVSCSDDRYQTEQLEMWKDLQEQNPEVIFAIGDNVYADWRNGQSLGKSVAPDILWDRYVETRSSLQIFREKKLIPFFAVWDDHDFGMNDGNYSYPHINPSRETMEAFFPYIADAKSILEGPGVAKAIKFSNHLFILFDDRSFRSPNEKPAICYKKNHDLCKRYDNQTTNPDSSHFGRVQEDWALGLIANHDGATWLVSGDQWFGSYHPFESFEGNHPINFKSFLRKLEQAFRTARKQKKRSYAIFVSGDRHLNETMKVKPFANYQTYEFTSSGIHAFMFPDSWRDFPNPRQIQGVSGEINYSIFDVEWGEKVLAIAHQARGRGNKVLYQKSLQLKPIHSFK